MSVMCPEYTNVSRQTLKRDAMRYYNEERRVIEDDLQKAPGRICFTTDNWRSDHTHDEYMCITTHWVFSFTVDNASYNDSMINSLRAHFMRKNVLLCNGDFFHMRCFAHIINLVVQVGLNLIDSVVAKIRSVVKHLNYSIPKRKKFYEYRDVLDNFVIKDKDIKVFNISSEEWKKVNELHKFLKVFYNVTNSFSGSNTLIVNVYFHGVWKIHKKLNDVYNGPPSFLSTMVSDMHEKFNKYWSEYNLVLSCAAVLDPRFKLERVEYCYEKLYGEFYAKEMIETIKNTIFELYDEYKDAIGESSRPVRSSSKYDTVLGVNSGIKDERDFAAFLSKKVKGGC
ncbi:zinc finger BED domain-containing protein RICESLEEPER 2-like [Silene latifolia]|uniref:zinc finger BED domain-containing protein RICESLEEPER 2-like n=1 Tax=Silene latifolia TaxID=37657 RepID=UPI003D77239D